MKRRPMRVSLWLAGAVACVAVGGAAWAVVPTHCISVDVPAPFVLPDGAVFPAGELRLCLSQNFNPVSGLHRVYVAHAPVGLMMSRVSNAETPKESGPSVLFYADAGKLRLVGYTVPSNGKVFSYKLWTGKMTPGIQVAANAGDVSGGSSADPGVSVLLAARLE